MIIGGKISPHASMIKTIGTCFFTQPNVLTVNDLGPFFAKDLLATISKKTGVSSMLPTSARGYLPTFKSLAQIS